MKTELMQAIPNDAEWAMQQDYLRNKVFGIVPENVRKLIKAEFISEKESDLVMFAYACDKILRQKVTKLLIEK